jgi:hypothetical protein
MGLKFHDAEIRKIPISHPHRLRWIGVNLKDPASFGLNDASSYWKNAFFIKIGLGQGDVTIVEGHPFFP